MGSTTSFHHELYDMLLDYADLAVEVEEVVVGLNWTMCRAGSTGLAQTVPGALSSWQHPLRGRELSQLSNWLKEWDPARAAVGLAAVNAALNREADIVTCNGAMFKGSQAMSNSIAWFAPMLRHKSVALVGEQKPLFDDYVGQFELKDFYHKDGGLHPACDAVLPECDWVFINARAIADKTLPHLLERSADSRVVLYGADVPWMDEWHHFGVDYLIGCELDNDAALHTAICEGQDVEQNAEAVHFRLINLQPASSVVPLETVSSQRHAATA